MQVALRWFCSRSLLKAEGLTKELIDRIPGKQTDRKTPLGELNWIFTAITDSIAWNMLPRSLFQRLFRQVASHPERWLHMLSFPADTRASQTALPGSMLPCSLFQHIPGQMAVQSRAGNSCSCLYTADVLFYIIWCKYTYCPG